MVSVILVDTSIFDIFGINSYHTFFSVSSLESQTGCVSGNVFQDENQNGINESDPGVASIEIEIFDCDNILAGNAFTDSMGDWQICGLTANVDYRVEINLTSAQANIYMSAISGLDNGSSVQFARENDILSYGLAMKNDSPFLFTSCYSYAGYQGPFKDIEAFIGVPINRINNPTMDANTGLVQYATHEQIGATYGQAINPYTDKAYVAAYLKRHTGFGPGGTGAIYEIDLTNTNPPTVFADLNAIYGANTAGVNPHDFIETDVCPSNSGPSTNGMCWFNDVDTWDLVGRTSLGDIDISPDMSTIFAMNLEDRSIYSIDLANPTAAQTVYPFPLDQDSDPNVTLKPRDPDYDIRPFGLKYQNGLIYAAAVDTEQSRDRDDICCARGGAVIYVYSLDPVTGIWTLVLEEDIQKNGPGPSTAFFIHWFDDFKDSFEDGAHMIVSDIEFDGDDMILGLRDLSADKFGYQRGKPIVGDPAFATSYQSVAGDVIRFCYDAVLDTFNFENNGSCGGITTSGAGFNNTGWPETTTPRGSYYTGDYFSSQHPQTSLGGIWQDPNSNLVYHTAYDILEVFEGGVRSLNNTTGLAEENYVLLDNTNTSSGFGKTAGLGDMESNVIFQPIEIGNRVWCDSIQNGIQDACERGVVDMIVQLYNDNGLLIGQDTTLSNGQYYFNFNNVDTTGITIDASGNAIPNTLWSNLAIDTKYYLVFGNGQFNTSSQAFVIGNEIYNGMTTFDANSNSNDNIDSDVGGNNLSIALGAIPAGLPQICITTDSTCVFHDYDLGVVCPEFDLAITKTVNTTASANPIIAGSNVSFDVTIINQGLNDAYDIDIQDYFDAAELSFVSLQAPATSVNGFAVSIVGAGPNFELEELEAGDEVMIQLNFTIVPSFTGTRIINNVEIVDASAFDNGPTAEDQDSPFSSQNNGSTNELSTDNDVSDERTGGMDNPSDEDDYDPAELTVLCQFNICLPISVIRN